jgi:hypothetical protein
MLVTGEGEGASSTGWQAPPTHVPPMQLWPHAPQFALSVPLMFVHAPPQVTSPLGHTQFEPEHDEPARCAEHASPQAPQLFGSDDVLTHVPPHAVSPAGHWHTPPFATLAQTSPETEHAPQVPPALPHDVVDWLPNASHVLPTQQPLQFVPELQRHIPLVQVVPAPQTLPQPPQLLLSLKKSAHPPLQGVKLALQV